MSSKFEVENMFPEKQIQLERNLTHINDSISKLLRDINYQPYSESEFIHVFNNKRREDLIFYMELEELLKAHLGKIETLLANETIRNTRIEKLLKEIENKIHIVFIQLASVNVEINERVTAHRAHTNIIEKLKSIELTIGILKNELQNSSNKINSNQNDKVLDEYVVDLEKAEYPNLKKYQDAYFKAVERIRECYAYFNPKLREHAEHKKRYLEIVSETMATSFGDKTFIAFEQPNKVKNQNVTNELSIQAHSLPNEMWLEVAKYLPFSTVAYLTQALGKTVSLNVERKLAFFKASLGKEKIQLIEKFKNSILEKDPNFKFDQNKLYIIAENLDEFAKIIHSTQLEALVLFSTLYFLQEDDAKISLLRFNDTEGYETASIKSLKAFYQLYLSTNQVGEVCLLHKAASKTYNADVFLNFLQVWPQIQISPALMKYVLRPEQNSRRAVNVVCSYEQFSLLVSRLTLAIPKAKSVAVKLSDETILDWFDILMKGFNHQEQIVKILNDNSIRFDKERVLEHFVKDILTGKYRCNIILAVELITKCPNIAISKEFFSFLMEEILKNIYRNLCHAEFLTLKSKVKVEANVNFIANISNDTIISCIKNLICPVVDSCTKKITNPVQALKETVSILLDDSFQFDKAKVLYELMKNLIIHEKYRLACELFNTLYKQDFELQDWLQPIGQLLKMLFENPPPIVDPFSKKGLFSKNGYTAVDMTKNIGYKQLLDTFIPALREKQPDEPLTKALIEIAEQCANASSSTCFHKPF